MKGSLDPEIDPGNPTNANVHDLFSPGNGYWPVSDRSGRF
jgi:hypothetical protein